jgi:hypothetical protein
MGMTISMLRLYSRRSVLSYQRRFPVVYFTYPAMRRPRFVNKQLEVYAFCVSIYQVINGGARNAISE